MASASRAVTLIFDRRPSSFSKDAKVFCFTLSVTNDVPGYAIVRLDLEPVYVDEDRFTVKRVVWSEDEASAEVARLNERLTAARTAVTSGSTRGLTGACASRSRFAWASVHT